MKYLITGGCGFLGSNIAAEILKRGGEVFVFDNLSRLGSEANLAWLQSVGNIKFYKGDIRVYSDIENVVKKVNPNVIFHLAGQVAMTTSIQNPRLDFEINVLGSINVLEAVRLHCENAAVIFSSTNKVYGDLEWETYTENDNRYSPVHYPNGFDEKISLDFHSPYGVSKGSADQYMLDYYRIFGIKTVVFRHSSMYGGRQFSTFDQGWIGWFCAKALEQKKELNNKTPFTVSGNGKQVRDLLYADDMANLYILAAEKIEMTKGQAFNIGGGIDNSFSLLELFSFLEKELMVQLAYTQVPLRESDQKFFVADLSKIEKFIGWKPTIDKYEGVRKMLSWVRYNNH